MINQYNQKAIIYLNLLANRSIIHYPEVLYWVWQDMTMTEPNIGDCVIILNTVVFLKLLSDHRHWALFKVQNRQGRNRLGGRGCPDPPTFILGFQSWWGLLWSSIQSLTAMHGTSSYPCSSRWLELQKSRCRLLCRSSLAWIQLFGVFSHKSSNLFICCLRYRAVVLKLREVSLVSDSWRPTCETWWVMPGSTILLYCMCIRQWRMTLI